MAVFTDDFDRANAASLGVNWTEVGVNAFQISTNRSLGLTNKKNLPILPLFLPLPGCMFKLKFMMLVLLLMGLAVCSRHGTVLES